MSTSFAKPASNASSKVGPSGYAAGSGALGLVSGGGAKFPALSTGEWYRLTVIRAAVAYSPAASATSDLTIFKATGLSSDNFTGLTAIEGTTDRPYASGDVVEVRVTAGTLSDLQDAVNAAEATIATSQLGNLPNGSIVKAVGGALVGANAGTDYQAPGGSGAGLTNLNPANIAAGTAGISITGTASTITGSIAESQVTGLTADLAARPQSATAETISGAWTFTQLVAVGTGSTAGDANAGLNVATGQHSIIGAFGTGLPSLKAYCMAAGGATTKIQSASTVGLIGTETNHPVKLIANNNTVIYLDATGQVYIGSSAPGSANAQFEVHAGSSGIPIQTWYQSNGSGHTHITPAGNLSFNTSTATVPSGQGIITGNNFGIWDDGSIALGNASGSSDRTIARIYRGTDTSPTADVFQVFASQAGFALFTVQAFGAVYCQGIQLKRTPINGTFTIQPSYGTFCAVTAIPAAFTITLPAANAVQKGLIYYFKDESGTAGTNNVTISPAGTDTGETTFKLTANYASLRLYSDGVSKWYLI